MRIGISASTAAVLASITVTVSSLALETNTRPAAARIPEGLLPPCTFGPNGRPVRMKVSNFGAAGAETSTTLTELDSRTLGSARPGALTGPRTGGGAAGEWERPPKVAARGAGHGCGCGESEGRKAHPRGVRLLHIGARHGLVLKHAEVGNVKFAPVGGKRQGEGQPPNLDRS